MPTSISTHVSSLLGVIVSALAVFHPGFTLTTTQTDIIIAIGTGGALVLQALHINLKATALKYLHEFQMQERRLAVQYPAITHMPTNPFTPQAPVVPVIPTSSVDVPRVSGVPVMVSTSAPKAAEGSNNVPLAAPGN